MAIFFTEIYEIDCIFPFLRIINKEMLKCEYYSACNYTAVW